MRDKAGGVIMIRDGEAKPATADAVAVFEVIETVLWAYKSEVSEVVVNDKRESYVLTTESGRYEVQFCPTTYGHGG